MQIWIMLLLLISTEIIKMVFEPFGLKELFKKIYDYFILSEDYINSCKVMDDYYVNKQAERLRARVKYILLSNKLWVEWSLLFLE